MNTHERDHLYISIGQLLAARHAIYNGSDMTQRADAANLLKQASDYIDAAIEIIRKEANQ